MLLGYEDVLVQQRGRVALQGSRRDQRNRLRRLATDSHTSPPTSAYLRAGLDAARNAVFAGVGPPVSTLIGVQALAISALMIEVEAIAVTD